MCLIVGHCSNYFYISRVSYLAGEFGRHLKNQIDKVHGENEEMKITPRDIVCLQVAGLCHDIGKPHKTVLDYFCRPELVEPFIRKPSDDGDYEQ